MATTLASLVVKIGADVTGVTAGMNTVQKRTRKLKKQFGSVTDSTLRWQSALGVLAGAAGLGLAAKAIFDVGAGVEETASKFNTVFGPSVEGATQFLDEFANTAGLTITQGRDLLATTGAIVQGMGMSQSASAEFAEEIVRLSGDLSSFNNIPIEETSRAVQSALTGERESLKRLGIVILETDVQKRALAMTGRETAAALTQEEKAMATLALITDRAGVAVGDLARTMESPANRARKLTAEVLDLRDSMASALLPAMNVVLGELSDISGSKGFSGLGDKLRENSTIIAAWATFAVETFKTVAAAIAAPVRIAFNLGEVIGKVLVAAFEVMRGNVAGGLEVLGSIVGEFGDMKESITNVIDGFDNMRIASGLAFQTLKDDLVPVVADETVPALNLAGAGFREMEQRVRITVPTIVDLSEGMRALAIGTNDAADATNRLAEAQAKLSAGLGFIGQLAGIAGIAIPGLGTASGVAGALGTGISLFSGDSAQQSNAPAAAATVVLNVGASRDPISLARDGDWLRALNESNLNLAAQGA